MPIVERQAFVNVSLIFPLHNGFKRRVRYDPLFVPDGEQEYRVNAERDDGEKSPNEEPSEQLARFAFEFQTHPDDLRVTSIPTFTNTDSIGQSHKRYDGKKARAQNHSEMLARRARKLALYVLLRASFVDDLTRHGDRSVSHSLTHFRPPFSIILPLYFLFVNI